MKKKQILVFLNNYIIIPLFFIIIYNILNSSIINNEYMYGLLPFLFFSFLIYVVLYFVFLGLYGNSKKSHITIMILLMLLLIINKIKILYTNQPIFISDLYMLKNTDKLFGLIKNNLFNILLSKIKYLFLIVVFLLLISKYSKFFNYKVTNKIKRLILSFIGLTFIYLIFSYNFFSTFIYNCLTNSIHNYQSYTTYEEMYNYLGLIGGMYINHYNDNLFNKYEDYNYDSLEKKIVNNDVTIPNNIGTPNIIVILSESFFDVSLLDENIVFDKDITHNFNELKNDGYLVDLISCSYGGMTVNVTYQLLTGSNMSIYNNGYIPFMKLFKDTNDYPSIVKELKNNGYKISEYLANDSYQVSKEFKKIGFDKYELIVSNNVKGYYISDDYMADFIIDEIEENNDKEFMLFQTMQNHMDYLVTKYPKYDISIKSSNLSTKANNLLLSYTQGIYDADKMLKKVYDYINTIDKDTILIFFGDHLPYLSDYDNVDELKKLDYFSTNDELINLYRKYNTQALILSNYDLSLNINSNLSTDNLLLSIINQMDIEVSDYYKYLYGLIDYLPSYNKYVYVDKNGKINYTKNLNSEEKSIFELKNALTYKKYIKE